MAITQSTPFNQADILKVYEFTDPGVCWELCRRWVKGRLAGTWKFDSTMFDIASSAAEFKCLRDEHVKRRDNIEQNNWIADLAYTHSAKRGRYNFGLRSRDDVINHVYSVKGVYIYQIGGRGKGGHTMAFDTRSDPAYFFDPNFGEWEFATAPLADVLNWWSGFWGTKHPKTVASYKTLYHKGTRELIRYNTLP